MADGAARPDGQGLAIVVNASAGSDDGDTQTREIRASLPAATLVFASDDLPLDAALDRSEAAPALGVLGGDGSINAATERAVASGRPLAVFPGGTLNHFARDAGIAKSDDTITAVQRGELMAVDVGLIDGRPFLNTASFGAYADLVDEREKLEGRIGKWAALVIATFVVLRRAEPTKVELNGETRRVWSIFIGNCAYEPPGLAPRSRARLDDGLFDVRYLDGTEARSRSRVLLSLVSGRLARSHVYKRMLVKSLDIRSFDGPLRLARDGETFDGGTDVRIAKHPERLSVYAPGGASDDIGGA